jgi:hypothetical protein
LGIDKVNPDLKEAGGRALDNVLQDGYDSLYLPILYPGILDTKTCGDLASVYLIQAFPFLDRP